MPGELSFTVVALFVGSLATLIGVGLAVIGMVLKAQHRHRARLARVGRRRQTGRYDVEDLRRSLARAEAESSTLVALTAAASRALPILDAARLRANIQRAGLSLSIGAFVLASLLCGAALAALAALATGAPLALVAPPGLYLGMLCVDGFVKLRGEAMAQRFMKQLPDALDTIIRGIRSGLPVIECIGTAGHESPAPIGPHFRSISERVQLGESLESAIWRVARDIGKPEMDFLAVSISIQMETGGSLAEALNNLATLLRERERMKLKIRAISSEAKASALIIGALPFVMLGLLAFMNPDYVMPLFTDPRGQAMLGAGLASIGLGAFVMWRMTRFEI